MRITQLDHLVLTVTDIRRATDFYSRVLGMKRTTFGAGRHALLFGNQKINLHSIDGDVELVASNPLPGSADLCFLTDSTLEWVIETLRRHGVAILAGPVERSGATGTIVSVYVRDPDGNLVEISNRSSDEASNRILSIKASERFGP